jgi:hypothetical protein
MNGYGPCPRCGCWGMEHLKSHSHCWECNHFGFSDDNHELSQWQHLEFRGADRHAQHHREAALAPVEFSSPGYESTEE